MKEILEFILLLVTYNHTGNDMFDDMIFYSSFRMEIVAIVSVLLVVLIKWTRGTGLVVHS